MSTNDAPPLTGFTLIPPALCHLVLPTCQESSPGWDAPLFRKFALIWPWRLCSQRLLFQPNVVPLCHPPRRLPPQLPLSLCWPYQFISLMPPRCLLPPVQTIAGSSTCKRLLFLHGQLHPDALFPVPCPLIWNPTQAAVVQAHALPDKQLPWCLAHWFSLLGIRQTQRVEPPQRWLRTRPLAGRSDRLAKHLWAEVLGPRD